MPSELLDRLNPIYDETLAADVMAHQSDWKSGWGNEIDPVLRIVVHETAGWPRRSRAANLKERYEWSGGPNSTNTCPTSKCGIGTQLFISNDGTVARLIDLPRETWHAPHVNGSALGVETTNRLDNSPPPSAHWIAASGEDNDIPGAKLWIIAINEVCPCWWTTSDYAGPGREPVGGGYMLFTEWQYRAWAILVRYLCERFRLPRNFPIMPHAVRGDLNTDARLFRRFVLADERAEVMKRIFAAPPYNIAESSFESENFATLESEYEALRVPLNTNRHREHNTAWTKYIEDDLFRGIHGHGYSGSVKRNAQNKPSDKTQCPGPLFDFYRLAREVWDWWWYPFDATTEGQAFTTRRSYRHWDKDTRLIEYYFDEREDLLYMLEAAMPAGIHGNTSSPTTFNLNPAASIYALANGELVAARFPPTNGGVSLAFTLVRHEVFHHLATPALGAIDYNRPPSSVYSLYMHLGRPAGMSFDEVHADNPDWLNRVLMRKKECDLGMDFYNHPTKHGVAQSRWDNRPPPGRQRPTTVEGWEADQGALNNFLNALRTGRTAVAPARHAHVQPIRVILGDFLGKSGVIRREGGNTTHGIRVETFSPSFSPPGFTQADTEDWSPQLATPYSLRYRSEWARLLTTDDADALAAIGVDSSQHHWWWEVVSASQADALLPADAKLPPLGRMYHFHPLRFMRWINEITWKHEWHKYQVTDAAGDPVPFEDDSGNPRRPRSRRIF